MRYYSREEYRYRLMRVPNSLLFGVCEGLARRLEVPVSMIRIFTILAFIFTGFFPVGLIYCLLAFLLPVGPQY